MCHRYSYTQALPSRFKKDIVRAAKLEDEATGIGMEGMQRVLENINMQDKISDHEMKVIFDEIGGESGEIPVDSMLKII